MEKQALVEARNWRERVDTLVALLEMDSTSASGNHSVN
jgi:Lon protease-like protein